MVRSWFSIEVIVTANTRRSLLKMFDIFILLYGHQRPRHNELCLIASSYNLALLRYLLSQYERHDGTI
jgi:hypothetical protein